MAEAKRSRRVGQGSIRQRIQEYHRKPSIFEPNGIIANDKDQPTTRVPDAATERLLSIVSDFAHAHPEFHPEFIYSLRRQFKICGRLSSKQIMVLCNIITAWRMLERKRCSQQNDGGILTRPVAP